MARPVQRVLLLTHRVPYPPDRGDRIRSWHLLRELAGTFRVSLACRADEPVSDAQRRRLIEHVTELAIAPMRPRPARLRGAAALVAGGSITAAMFDDVGLGRTVLDWHRREPFDAVVTFCTGMISFSRRVLAAGQARPRHVLDLVDVDSVKWADYARESWPPLRWVYGAESRRLRRLESGDAVPCDAITVISDAEAEAYRRHVVADPPALHVVGNGVDLDYFQPLPDPASHTLAFVGVLNYRPNVEGITWFVREVMPRLRQRVLDAELLIVGRHPTAKVQTLGRQPGVKVLGPVPDVRAPMSRAAVVVAPLLLARGVQNKVLEAMASGRAVVCTPAAAEGIEATHGEHLVVAHDPGQWAEHLARLLTHPARRHRLAVAARQRVEQRYGWAAALRPMIDLVRGDT